MCDDQTITRIAELEQQLAEKDQVIAGLVARLFGSREKELEDQIKVLEEAVRKWSAAALKGKIEIKCSH